MRERVIIDGVDFVPAESVSAHVDVHSLWENMGDERRQALILYMNKCVEITDAFGMDLPLIAACFARQMVNEILHPKYDAMIGN